MSFETITFGITNQVARIGLNRPKVFNALNRQLVDELAQAVSQMAASEEIRAAVVKGMLAFMEKRKPVFTGR
jgi:enoyl-CoA hydratase/carnithine racemase